MPRLILRRDGDRTFAFPLGMKYDPDLPLESWIEVQEIDRMSLEEFSVRYPGGTGLDLWTTSERGSTLFDIVIVVWAPIQSGNPIGDGP